MIGMILCLRNWEILRTWGCETKTIGNPIQQFIIYLFLNEILILSIAKKEWPQHISQFLKDPNRFIYLFIFSQGEKGFWRNRPSGI